MKTSSNRTAFHLWFPNIFDFKGGIQVYSRFLLEALQSLNANSDYDIFLKHDTSASPDFRLLTTTRFHVAGNWPLLLRTPAFAAKILGYGLWQRPNLIIATHLNFTIAAYWLKRLVGVPYWTVAHGIEAWNIQPPALKKALARADKILAVSSYTRERLIKEQNLDPAKISLLANTFDEDRFQILPKPQYLLKRYGLTIGQPIILTVARLNRTEAYKGYDKILKSLPEIRGQIPNIHYIIVGKGDDQPRVEQLIQSLNLQSNVTLTGFIPDGELPDHYHLCDVFAMPSKGEGFGIVYLEALACGKPTLGGNQDGTIDALCHGTLGALVDPDNLGAISKTLVQILQGTYPNPLMYKPESLRQKVIHNFGFERFKQTIAGYLDAQLHVSTMMSNKSTKTHY